MQDKELSSKKLIGRSQGNEINSSFELKKPRPQTQVSPKVRVDSASGEANQSQVNIIAPSNMDESHDETYISNKTN